MEASWIKIIDYINTPIYRCCGSKELYIFTEGSTTWRKISDSDLFNLIREKLLASDDSELQDQGKKMKSGSSFWWEMKTIMTTIIRPEFVHVLFDVNQNLIAFSNGVYDLGKHRFRKAVADDYLFRQLPYEYKEHPSAEGIKRWYRYFNEITSDKASRERLLDDLCSLIRGRDSTSPNNIVIKGDVSTGKSVLMALIGDLLGSYALISSHGYNPLSHPQCCQTPWFSGLKAIIIFDQEEFSMIKDHKSAASKNHTIHYPYSNKFFLLRSNHQAVFNRTVSRVLEDESSHDLKTRFVSAPSSENESLRVPMLYHKLSQHIPDLMSLLLDRMQV